jgi:hypothetical protein
MKKLLYIVVITFSQFAFAQQSKIDSLIHLLKTDKVDTTKLIRLYNISDESETIGNYPEEKVHRLKRAKPAFFTKIHRIKDIIKARTSKLLGISYI